MIKLIDAELPNGLDFTVPSRFMNEHKFPGRTNFHPTSHALEAECNKYKINWLALWCIGYVLSNSYYNSENLLKRNYFKLMVDGKLQPFRTWQEGMRAGVQTIAMMMGLSPVDPVVWPGSNVLGKAYGKIKELKEFDTHYGDGFSASVEKIYAEFVAFVEHDKEQIKLPEPVVIGPDIQLPPAPAPTFPDQDQLPEPSRPLPETKPKAKLPWQLKLAGAMSALAIPWWFLEKFLPGWAGILWDLLKKLSETQF